VDQVSSSIPYRSSNEQRCHRLFRRKSTDRSPGPGALLINRSGGLAGLVCDVASGTLDRIYRQRSGARGFLSQVGGSIHHRAGTLLQIPEHGLGLIDLLLNHFLRPSGEVTDGVPNLRRRIAHDSLTVLLIHRLLPTQLISPVSLLKQASGRKHSFAIFRISEIGAAATLDG
jgi:hypothetical protein